MIDDTLTMIPGPTPVEASILAALARPTTSHQFPSFVEAYRRCLDNTRKILRADSGQPFVVSGSGTLAMEMALVNLVGGDEKLLILSQGYFGDRWSQLADAFDIPFDLVQCEWGQVVAPEELGRKLSEGSYSAVAMTHVDTSTGAAAPVDEYARLLRGRGELALLDGVCATAGMDERFDDWGIDALLTGAQKALGTPPGLAILAVSERAMSKRKNRDNVPAYNADLLRWLPIMENPALYFSTPPVNEILAYLEGTEIVLREGLDDRIARHERIANAFRSGIAALGLGTFTDKGCLANTLTVVRYPEGVDDTAFRAGMAERKVVVAGGLGPAAGKAFRVGHMGNIGAGEVTRTLETIESTLRSLGHEARPGAAIAAAAAHF